MVLNINSVFKFKIIKGIDITKCVFFFKKLWLKLR